MSDIFTFKYLDYPAIPEELLLSIPDAEKQPKYPVILYNGEVDNRKTGEPSRVSHYQINSELREWLEKHLKFEFHADYMLQRVRGVKHTDHGRVTAINYIIDTGGKMIGTAFFDPEHPEKRISGKIFPPRQWHMINAGIPHCVEGELTIRYILSITPIEASRWCILPWEIK